MPADRRLLGSGPAAFLAFGFLLVGTAPSARAGSADAAPAATPEPLPRQVGEVTVTATRAERGVLEVPGHVTVIDRAAIEQSGARDVPELLRREAGIFVTQDATNPTGYSVEARGFANGSGVGSSLLVLVDGRRVNEPDSSVADWALLHLDHVERIEVVRGPTSAVHGDNAVGGVIQIVTRRPEGALRATLRGRAGSYDSDGASLVASGAHGPVGVAFFAEGASADGYRERSDFRTRAFEGKLRFDLGERASATLVTGYSSDERDRPGSLSRDELETLGRRAADPRNLADFDDARRSFVQGILQWAPREGIALELVPFYRRRSDRGAITDSGLGRTLFDTDTQALGLNSQLQLDGSVLGRAHRLQIGLDLLREDLDSDSRFEGPFLFHRHSRRESVGVFVQQELELSPDLLLSGGLRFDHARYRLREISRFASFDPTKSFTRPNYEVWSPRLGLTRRLTESASAYVSYARGFRFPNLDETSGVFGANPRIRPQKSDSYEVGLRIREERVRANLALYHMEVDDEILLDSDVVVSLFDPGAGGFVSFLGVQNVNMERVRHRGLEASLSVRPTAWLELYGSYTLDDAKVLRDTTTNLEGHRVPVTPRHRGSWGVRLTLPQRVELGFHAHVVGSRFAVNDFGHDLRKLSRHSVYDGLLAFRPRISAHVELAVTAAVRNLFDREYAELGGRSSFVPLSDFESDPEAFFRVFPAAERSYELGLAVTVRR